MKSLPSVDQLQSAERNAREPVAAFIRIARVKEISGCSKSTIWRWINATPSKFPRPVVVSGNSVLWDLAEVLAWRADQFKKRDQRIAEQTQPEQATA